MYGVMHWVSIVRKVDRVYFALTARHVILDRTQTKLIIGLAQLKAPWWKFKGPTTNKLTTAQLTAPASEKHDTWLDMFFFSVTLL